MIRKQWGNACVKHFICVDSYENRILQGRLNGKGPEEIEFSSLMDLMVKLEEQPAEAQATETEFYLDPPAQQLSPIRRGAKATFELQILFRQHSSWQGLLKWREKNIEQSFKSVLELMMLIESALDGE